MKAEPCRDCGMLNGHAPRCPQRPNWTASTSIPRGRLESLEDITMTTRTDVNCPHCGHIETCETATSARSARRDHYAAHQAAGKATPRRNRVKG